MEYKERTEFGVRGLVLGNRCGSPVFLLHLAAQACPGSEKSEVRRQVGFRIGVLIMAMIQDFLDDFFKLFLGFDK